MVIVVFMYFARYKRANFRIIQRMQGKNALTYLPKHNVLKKLIFADNRTINHYKTGCHFEN